MKTSLVKLANQTKTSLIKHSPAILVGMGIVGFGMAIVDAVRETPKALSLIDDEVWARYEEEYPDEDVSFAEYLGLGDGDGYSLSSRMNILTKKEIFSLTWKCYLPSAILAGVSTACIIGANNINAKRNAVLATAYSLSEAALREYKNKVVEVVGEKKEKEVRDKIAKDRIDRKPVVESQVIVTEKGSTLCYDYQTGRYFKSDMQTIRSVVNDLNFRMIDENYISLNDFYYEIGLPMVDLGDRLGWNIEGGKIEISTSAILTDKGEPCIALDYTVAPRYDYRNLH